MRHDPPNRVGVFGGSFDPLHAGHVLLAECCWRQARLDRVELVPAARQPHKPHGPVASDRDRLEMARLAVAGRPELAVSSAELERGGVSYTVDTLRDFRARWPGAELFFLMGADSLADLPTWREPQAICEIALPLVVRRAGAPPPDFAGLQPLVAVDRLEQIRAAQVEMPETPISSSQIRQLVADGGQWRSLVPEPVADYIDQHGLYRP